MGVRLNPEDRRVYVKENGPPQFLTLKLLDFDDVHEVAEEKDINKRNQEIVDLYNGDKNRATRGEKKFFCPLSLVRFQPYSMLLY